MDLGQKRFKEGQTLQLFGTKPPAAEIEITEEKQGFEDLNLPAN